MRSQSKYMSGAKRVKKRMTKWRLVWVCIWLADQVARVYNSESCTEKSNFPWIWPWIFFSYLLPANSNFPLTRTQLLGTVFLVTYYRLTRTPRFPARLIPIRQPLDIFPRVAGLREKNFYYETVARDNFWPLYLGLSNVSGLTFGHVCSMEGGSVTFLLCHDHIWKIRLPWEYKILKTQTAYMLL